MVGEYFDAAGKAHGYLRGERGVITKLDAPGAVRGTLPLAINNRGAVVGWYFGDTSVHGFVFENGRFIPSALPVR
jgi:probable HAF family extracellular repeat protein